MFFSLSFSFNTRTNLHISWTSLEDSSSCTCMSTAHMKNSCQEVATWLTGTVLDFGSSFCSELLWHEQKHPSLCMWNRESNCYSEKLSIKFCQVFFFFFLRTVGGWSFGGSAVCYWLWLQVKHFLASKCKSSTGRSRKTFHDTVVWTYFEAKVPLIQIQ